jgi:hypothetical protein
MAAAKVPSGRPTKRPAWWNNPEIDPSIADQSRARLTAGFFLIDVVGVPGTATP